MFTDFALEAAVLAAAAAAEAPEVPADRPARCSTLDRTSEARVYKKYALLLISRMKAHIFNRWISSTGLGFKGLD